MPITSSGNYEQTPPPGPIVVLTDTGGGDRTRKVTCRYRWSASKVIVGGHRPRKGFTIDKGKGRCQWKLTTGLGRKKFKLGLRSNGTGSSKVYAVVTNKRANKSKTFRHTITIPNRATKKRRKKA